MHLWGTATTSPTDTKIQNEFLNTPHKHKQAALLPLSSLCPTIHIEITMQKTPQHLINQSTLIVYVSLEHKHKPHRSQI